MNLLCTLNDFDCQDKSKQNRFEIVHSNNLLLNPDPYNKSIDTILSQYQIASKIMDKNKDSLRNVESGKDFVINTINENLTEVMNQQIHFSINQMLFIPTTYL
jgi:hypothetical protein